eukprot:gb/GEZN01014825.1/.p1 GENE.gb/GEZN01014825.1/~~gb/GEZN01014825.1/.p1  ORF type:complete len:157 (+),score=25.12 gb/GEZN01014825.1/:28-471(+)
MSMKDEDLKEGFKLFDADGDGLLSTTKDLGRVLRALGQVMSEDALSKLVSSTERKHGESLDFPTFLAIYKAKDAEPKDKAEDLKAAFEVFDEKKTGKISAGEFRHIITNLGEKMTDEQCERLMKDADPSKSGSVDYNAFITRLLSRP